MTNQTDRAPDPQRRRIRRINVAVVLVLLAGAAVTWLVLRDERLEPGAIADAASIGTAPSRLADFATPGGVVRVRVSAPREQVEPADYGDDAPAIGRGDRFLGIDVYAQNEGVRERLDVALISAGERYRLDALREDPYWLVVDGEGEELAVELSYDGAKQRVDLDSGERTPGLADDLEEKYRAVSCTVTATNPAGRTRPIQQWCPELVVTASTWDEAGGWVDAPEQRWVRISASPLRPLNLIGRWESLDMRPGVVVLVDGEPAEAQTIGQVARVSAAPTSVELRYRGRMYQSREWTITVRADVTEVAR